MKLFKLFSIGYKIDFLPTISDFFNSVAMAMQLKKSKSETKILISSYNQKSLNNFTSK